MENYIIHSRCLCKNQNKRFRQKTKC